MRFIHSLFLSLLLCVAMTAAASAQNFVWNANSGGNWMTASNWLGNQMPQGSAPGDILIRPDFGGIINGPTVNVVATSLTLGADLGITTLLASNSVLMAFNGGVTIEADGRLETPTNLLFPFAVVGTLANAGEILNSGGTISAGLLTNSGLLRGRGSIGAPVVNSGRIELIDQTSEMNFFQTLTNQAAGLVAVRDTDLRVFGGLTNLGGISINGSVDLFTNVNNTGSIGVTSGTTLSLVGDLVQNGTVNLLAGSKLSVFGDFSGGGGTTGSGTLEVLGTVSPGSSPAHVSFGGDLALGGSSRTLIELAGRQQGAFDALAVHDSIALGGTLDVSLLNGFTPQLGDVFPIVTAGDGISGTFNLGTLPDLGATLSLRPFYTDNSVLLAVVPAIAGDYNADGNVDAADYVVWRKMQGQLGPALIADGNDNGQIDPGDYTFWRARFGQPPTAAASAAVHSPAAPEPASLTLFIFALSANLALNFRRRI